MVIINKVSKSTFKKTLLAKLDNKLMGKNKIIFKKSDVILNSFINMNFLIYKGCFYRNIKINKFIIGYRFGEFSYTRKPFRYLLKSKKK